MSDAMNLEKFKLELKMRGEEYQEYEDQLVGLYARKIGNVQNMLRGPMIMAYRTAIIDLIDHLDQKVKAKRYERDLAIAAKQDFLGESQP